MMILTGFCYLHFSFEINRVFHRKKKIHSDFVHILANRSLKYERNRIFHRCCDMFAFYGQALLSFIVIFQLPVLIVDFCHVI